MNKQLSFIFISATFLFLSCGNPANETKTETVKTDSVVAEPVPTDCASYFKAARKADSILLVATTMNKADAEKALSAFNQFASFCKEDTLAPVFLLKGGQVARSVGNFMQAQAMLKQCADEYPKFKNRGAALFLSAQLYDEATMLNDEAEAKKLYQQIIKEYPKTPYATDAKAAMANLGKTDEQLIQEFLKKNK